MLNNRSIACILFLFSVVGIHAQNKQLLYNFSEIPQSLMLNPGGKLPGKAYIGVPLFSGIYASASSSGLSVYDAFEDGKFDDINARLDYGINELNRNDVQRASEQIELLNAGFDIGGRFNNLFLSFGIYKEIDFFNYWPEDMAHLAYYGNQTTPSRVYDFSDANIKGEAITVFHVGLQHKPNEKWTIGGRFKFYSSHMDVTSTQNTGRFQGGSGGQQLVNADVEVHTSGNSRLKEVYRYIRDDVFDGNVNPVSDAIDLHKKVYTEGPFIGKNLGVGVDLGFTYEPNKRWLYSASILDLGFIKHNDDVINYNVDAVYGFDGTSSNPGGGVDDLLDVLDGNFSKTENSESYTNMRPVEFYGSVMYRFGYFRSNKPCHCGTTSREHPAAVGLQLYAEKRPRYPQAALTAFYYRKIWEALRIKGTYTVDKYSKSNIGLGLSAHFANFNLYFLADNLLEYGNLADANTLSFQMGLNYIFPAGK